NKLDRRQRAGWVERCETRHVRRMGAPHRRVACPIYRISNQPYPAAKPGIGPFLRADRVELGRLGQRVDTRAKPAQDELRWFFASPTQVILARKFPGQRCATAPPSDPDPVSPSRVQASNHHCCCHLSKRHAVALMGRQQHKTEVKLDKTAKPARRQPKAYQDTRF